MNQIIYEACDFFNVEKPETIIWKKRYPHYFSCGEASNHYIKINYGTDGLDLLLVVLHETAHHIVKRDGHDRLFWDTVCCLYKEYKIPFEYIIYRELNYKINMRYSLEAIYKRKVGQNDLELARREINTNETLRPYPNINNFPRPIFIKNKWVREDYNDSRRF
jgi:hypothetical protein